MIQFVFVASRVCDDDTTMTLGIYTNQRMAEDACTEQFDCITVIELNKPAPLCYDDALIIYFPREGETPAHNQLSENRITN